MIYSEGYVYHIKDSYFNKVNDNKLMANKENENFRPTYYCFKDTQTSLLWVVPMSSKYKKYEKIFNNKVQKYGKCDTIILGEFDNVPAAFLIQNMFPITAKYLDHIHTRRNNPVPVNYKLRKEIYQSANRVLHLTRKGYNLVYPDILKLEQIMLTEITPKTLVTKIQIAKQKAQQYNSKQTRTPKKTKDHNLNNER